MISLEKICVKYIVFAFIFIDVFQCMKYSSTRKNVGAHLNDFSSLVGWASVRFFLGIIG